MIRKGTDEDFEEIFNIINDAAMAYQGRDSTRSVA